MLTPEEWSVIALSMRVACTAIGLSLPAAMAVAYGLARDRIPAGFIVENLVQLPLVLPPVVTGLLLLYAVGPESAVGEAASYLFGTDIAFTWIGAVLAAAIVAFPLMVQPMRVAFEQVDPSIEEAARVVGAGRLRVFFRITIPLAARGIAAGTTLGFGRALGEFGATIVLAGNLPERTRTIPLAIFTRINQIGGEAAAVRLVLVAVGLSVLSLAAHAILTRHFHRPADKEVKEEVY